MNLLLVLLNLNRLENYAAFLGFTSDKERQSRAREKCRALTQWTLLLLPSYERNPQSISVVLKRRIV